MSGSQHAGNQEDEASSADNATMALVIQRPAAARYRSNVEIYLEPIFNAPYYWIG
jgi:hypothetical protein